MFGRTVSGSRLPHDDHDHDNYDDDHDHDDYDHDHGNYDDNRDEK